MTKFRAVLAALFIAFVLPGSVSGSSSEAMQKLTDQKAEVDALRQTIKRQRVVIHRWHRYARKVEIRLTRARRQLQATVRIGTVSYAIRLASIIYGVSEYELRAVGSCESHLDPFAVNGTHRGVFQEGSMFERGPFGRLSVWDPFANVFTAASTVRREGWKQWTCKP